MDSRSIQLEEKLSLLPCKQAVYAKIGICTLAILLLISCSHSDNQHLRQKVIKEDSILKSKIVKFSTDSLLRLLDDKAEDDYTRMQAYKELGERMRNASKFQEAIFYHQQGLRLASKLKDTIEITLALNNLGTNFRRIGDMSEASEYHFLALQSAESFSGKDSKEGRKSKVMAMNGIGNVYLSIEDYEKATMYFREALVEEKKLKSTLGQAINYANLGAIFEKQALLDSAYYYYQLSYEQNLLANSPMGIGLSHINFGHIFERKEDYLQAQIEYQQAYTMLNEIADKWHKLETIIALARIHLLKNDLQNSKRHIDLAKEVASEIHSPQHLSEIYDLLHQYYLKQNNYAEALTNFKISKAYHDSIQSIQKLNKVIEMRLNYERDKNRHFITQLSNRNLLKSRENRIIIIASFIIVILLVLWIAVLFYAYKQRTRSNRMLRNLNRIRNDFYAKITHEFRTPLTVILGLSEQMQNQQQITSKETVIYLKAIDRQGNHLLSLVNQLLKSAKINAGIDTPNWVNGNIIAYLKVQIDAFQLYSETKNLKISLITNMENLDMDFVPDYMDNIIQNLLSNAIKFSFEGGIIHVSVATTSNNEIELKVTDYGSGIASEDLEHVFELFYQGRQTNNNAGSGIGLNFTQQLVESMHGKIKAEHNEKNGTVFTINLPLRQAGIIIQNRWQVNECQTTKLQPGNESADYNQHPENNGTEEPASTFDVRPTILLVEDNDDVGLYISSILSDSYQTILAHNGIEGLELAHEIVPDIIVSDIMMPYKDGFELCSEVRASELLNHIPIIIITAKSTLDDQLKGLKCGADAYIRKPFRTEELRVQIEALIENRRLLKDKYLRSILKKDKSFQEDMNIDFLQKITDIIYSEMRNPDFSPIDLANKLNLSISQLNRKLSAVAGYTTLSYILKLRIDNAKKKLAADNKPIGIIAEECGFIDVAYFSRIFKKHTNVTPSQYRRMPH